jgi:hypothetical protein
VKPRPHRAARATLAAVAAVVVAAALSVVSGPDATAGIPDRPANDPSRGMIYTGLRPARTGACAGRFEVVGVDITVCTHGPDAPPAGLSVKTPIQPIPARADATAPALVPQALAVCEGDGVTGRRVEVLYVHGSTDRYNQFLETFRTLAESVDTVYNSSAQETGGERHVRFVTETVNGACRPAVRNVTIADSALNANDWAPLLNAVRAAGFTRTDRKYLEFVDAQVFCGIGGFPGDTRKSDANRANTGPEYARADSGCWTAGVAAHELGHTLGAVNNNAPNASGFAHCVDEWDVMCYKDNAATVIVTRCADRAHDQRLDCNHDDYYSTNPPAGSYLANFFNVADNLFLIRGGSVPPPPPPTTFRLVNAASGTCMDDPASNTTNGTQLIIWSCNGGQNQLVTQNGATLRILGKCADASGSGTGNGTRVVLSDCTSAANQQWNLRADGSIAGVQSGRCISPTNGATANNTPLVLFDCNGQPFQRWTRS